MPFTKGDPNINAGRPKGVPNKVTTEIRKAYEMLIANNIDNMSHWLNAIAADDPEKALNILIRLSPFVLPKKQEISADENFQPIQLIIPQKPKENE